MNRWVFAGAAVLLVAGCGSSAPAATPKGAVAGRVLSAPSCPVEQQGVLCPPRPVSDAAVVVLRAGQVIASTHTDTRGRFHVTVSAGRCRVRATNAGGLATTASKVVTVHADRVVYVRLVVDSGIR
jgi:hypothetical protein